MDSPLIRLAMDNAKIIIGTLKAIQFKDLATVFATANGLKVTVEDAKCIQGNAFLQGALFREYHLKKDIISFKININVLIDCLSMFGTSVSGSPTSLVLTYKEFGGTLDLLLEENGVVAECNIRTMEAFEILDFDFLNNKSSDKVILKSECMREAFNELDMTSEVLELTLLPPPATQPRIRLTTYGLAGTTHFDLPRSSDQVEVFESSSESPRVARYRLSLLRSATSRVLAMACRISLRINDRGFLSMQHMINLPDGQAAFVEFFCVPDEEEDDESTTQGSQKSSSNIEVPSSSGALTASSTRRQQAVLEQEWSD